MSILTHPDIHGLEIGESAWFKAQRRMVKEKPLIRECYDQWYGLLKRDVESVPHNTGLVVELGSGAGYIKEWLPETITSDITEGNADMVLDARSLPFKDSSVRGLLLTHVFHHIPDIQPFFQEASRVLVPGGVISMIECAHTPLSRVFFGKIHPEPYDFESTQWEFPPGNTMLDSNQALSWLVFSRDQKRFAREFPEFSLEEVTYLPWLGYLLSGGVNLRSMVPKWLVGPVRSLDRLSRRFDSFGAIHWHITLRKKL